MKVTGDVTLHAPIATVWAALNDPAILVQAIPGCERLTATAPDTYELTVTAAIGAIAGTYTGQIALTGQQPPTALVLKASGAGSPGTVTTSVLVELADNSKETVLRFDADATIGGMIAGVGQRMLAGIAKRQATQFFTALDQLLLGQAAAAAGVTGEALAPGGGMAPATGEVPGAGVPGAEVPGAGRLGAALPGAEELLAGGAVAGTSAGPGAAAPPRGGPGAAQPAPGRRAAGAAGVSSPTDGAAHGVSGMTWERRPVPGGQPAGLRSAVPSSASFLQGTIVGAAIALAGVVVGGLIARRKR